MRITRTRSRRGISTLMGTLVFVGILFTTIVPMYIVMQQADVLLDKAKLEMKRSDDERANEAADVFVYPTDPEEPSQITVRVFNKCEMLIRIVRVWVNGTYLDMGSSWEIDPMEDGTYEVTVNAEGVKTYDVRVTSERNNVYAAKNGILSYDDNGWAGEAFGINIVIPSREPWMNNEKWDGPYDNFNVTITKLGTPDVVEYECAYMTRAVSASETFFSLSEQGNYHVTAMVHCSKKGTRIAHWHTILDDEFEIKWPDGDPIINITLYAVQGDSPYCSVTNCIAGYCP